MAWTDEKSSPPGCSAGVSDVLDQHYEKVVKAYDNPDLFFRNPEYDRWMMQETMRQLGLLDHHLRPTPAPLLQRKEMTLVDMGIGNGRFTNSLVDMIQSEAQRPVCCVGVDPYPEMLNVAASQPHIRRTLCLDAFAFASLPPDVINYSHIIMKEMIHHLCAATHDLSPYFENIRGQLDDSGRVVVVTRPVDTDYPFFERIHQIWRTTQPPHETVVTAMEAARLTVTVYKAQLPVRVSTAAWLAFIRNKTWSEFSMCSEGEMAVGLGQLEERFRGQDEIEFNERIIFVTGTKQPQQKKQTKQSI